MKTTYQTDAGPIEAGRAYHIDYYCDTPGPGIEEGEMIGRWTGEIDCWGKLTIEDVGDYPTTYLFPREFTSIEPADDSYFVVLDEAPIKGSPTPRYELLYGDPHEACGYAIAAGRTIRGLFRHVPDGQPIYRVWLQRTDGRTGLRLIRAGNKAEASR